MRKVFLGVVSMITISGCMVDPMTSIDFMKGSGSINRTESGQTTFRYVVHADAYKDIALSPDEVKSQHEWLIGSYIGEGGYCPNGYQITKQTMEQSIPAYVYEGVCR